jgi:prepilin-type processing-associated H-X9-DG protein
MSNLPPAAPAAQPKTSRLAIASLVCGIVGPCTVGLASIAGIILGIVGLVKIGGSAAALRGRGLAIAGIVVSVVGILILPVLAMLAAILLPAVFGAREMAYSASSANNVKQLCSVTMQYATSHRQKLPPADTWPEVFQEQVGLSPQVMADPADEGGGRAYAMNAALAGGTIVVPAPGQTVLFFECRPGSPPSGGPDLLPEKPRHAGRYVIGFLDGHVESVPPDRVRSYIWEPPVAEAAGR